MIVSKSHIWRGLEEYYHQLEIFGLIIRCEGIKDTPVTQSSAISNGRPIIMAITKIASTPCLVALMVMAVLSSSAAEGYHLLYNIAMISLPF
jgi:hypothetical protein